MKFITKLSLLFLLTISLIGNLLASPIVKHNDEIRIYFPKVDGPDAVSHNITTVLSLSLAQTMRKKPWPDNPNNNAFGDSKIIVDQTKLPEHSQESALDIAQSPRIMAQLVIWGKAYSYANDVLVDVNITLPKFQSNDQRCNRSNIHACDYREHNYEYWKIPIDNDLLVVGPPRRFLSISELYLNDNLVQQFSEIKGLPITDDREGKVLKGHTTNKVTFLQTNRWHPKAPARVKSGATEGYVQLPPLLNIDTEYADLTGGLLQLFRGDWEAAHKSFTSVVNNKTTSVSNRIDALLYLGRVAALLGQKNFESYFLQAENLAPNDRMIQRYKIMGMLHSNAKKSQILRQLKKKIYLFNQDDAWLVSLQSWLDN